MFHLRVGTVRRRRELVWSVDRQHFPAMMGGHADERRHAVFRKGDDFAVFVDEDAGALAFDRFDADISDGMAADRFSE